MISREVPETWVRIIASRPVGIRRGTGRWRPHRRPTGRTRRWRSCSRTADRNRCAARVVVHAARNSCEQSLLGLTMSTSAGPSLAHLRARLSPRRLSADRRVMTTPGPATDRYHRPAHPSRGRAPDCRSGSALQPVLRAGGAGGFRARAAARRRAERQDPRRARPVLVGGARHPADRSAARQRDKRPGCDVDRRGRVFVIVRR